MLPQQRATNDRSNHGMRNFQKIHSKTFDICNMHKLVHKIEVNPDVEWYQSANTNIDFHDFEKISIVPVTIKDKKLILIMRANSPQIYSYDINKPNEAYKKFCMHPKDEYGRDKCKVQLFHTYRKSKNKYCTCDRICLADKYRFLVS